MFGLDKREPLFIVWAFTFQIFLIIHFALRKRFFDSYTMNFGWIIYALSIPAVVISIVLLLGRKMNGILLACGFSRYYSYSRYL